MSKQTYPLDINVLRSVALEGGLNKYHYALPNLPDNMISFVREWNRALMYTLRKPEFKKHLGLTGRAIVELRSPGLAAFAADKINGPHCSFYYAKSFVNAYNHISDKVTDLQKSMRRPTVVDFGRGLSPLMNLIQQDCRYVKEYAIEHGIINEVYSKASHEMGFYGDERVISVDYVSSVSHDVFASLGTFSRLPIHVQKSLLTDVVKNFQHFYVELEHDNTVAPMDIKDTAQLQGWNSGHLNEIFGNDGYKKTGLLNEFMNENRQWLDWLTMQRIAKKLCHAKEIFIQR